MPTPKESNVDWTGGDHHAVWLRLSYQERLEWLESAQRFAQKMLGAARKSKKPTKKE